MAGQQMVSLLHLVKVMMFVLVTKQKEIKILKRKRQSIHNPFEPRDILFTPRPLYIHPLSKIVSFPDAHAFRSQREITVFRYSRNLISSTCWHHWLVNLAFRNTHSCNSSWGLQAFLFFSLCDFQQHVEGAVCKGRSFCHISPYPTEGQRNLSRLLWCLTFC